MRSMRKPFLKITLLAAGLVLGIATQVAAPSAAMAQPASTWDRVATQKILRVGLIPNRPPYQFLLNGQQEGLAIQMGKDLAAALSQKMGGEVKIQYINSTWSTIVLDLQAGNADVFFGMTDTPERRKALAMFGPLYSVPVVALNAANTNPGANWSDYDKDTLQIATIMGTTDADAAKAILHKAKLRALRSLSEGVLDLQSGQSQALITSLLIGLDASTKVANPGKLVLLQPVQSAPSGAGATRDADGRFAAFAQQWADTYRDSGRPQIVVTDAIAKSGLPVDRLPAGVRFR
jgi:polar amino acid transport system substrate-binding protein